MVPGCVLGSVGIKMMHFQREKAGPGGHVGLTVLGAAALLASWVSSGRQSPGTSVPALSAVSIR